MIDIKKQNIIASYPDEINRIMKLSGDTAIKLTKYLESPTVDDLKMYAISTSYVIARCDSLIEKIKSFAENFSENDLTHITLMQQVAILEKEKKELESLYDTLDISSRALDRSEREKRASEILAICRRIQNATDKK